MKITKATSGPYRQRLHYQLAEIEHITANELRTYDLLPSTPGPINIDRYVEHRFLTPRYEDLPPALLGYTAFGPDGPIDIAINEQLASDPSITAKRRVRTTIAHEGGHALLHSILHAETGQSSLLPIENEPRIMCKEEDLARTSYDGKWWEYQANLAMGCLLLPEELTLTAVRPYRTATPLGGMIIEPHAVPHAARALSTIFDVNPVVAKIRIQQLCPA